MLVPSQESAKKFRKLFEHLSHRESYGTVFNDFLDYTLLMLNINKKPEDFADLEKRWPKKEDQLALADMLIEYSNIAEGDGQGFYDGLGDLFMELLSFGKNGQFFTPQCICDMMAQMSIGEQVKDGLTVADPTCGSGRMLLAAAKMNRKMKFYAADLDITCCKMTAINMILNTMEGEVAWMNTLSMEHWKSWHIRKVLDCSGHYLPYYYVTGPGETDFVQKLSNTMEMKDPEPVPNQAEEAPVVGRKQQLLLFT